MKSVSLIKFAEIQEALCDCTRELFDAYECPVEHVEDSADPSSVLEEAVTAIIGYGGPNLRGALLLVSSREFVETLIPGSEGAEDAVLCDVLAEFSNMLLGRLKNSLLERGVVFHLAIPMASTAHVKHLPQSSGGSSTWHAFRSDRGMVFARFHAVIDAGLVLPPPRAAPPPTVAEGDVIEF
jgi:CheY-specific phosphatase CheX